MFVRSNLFLQWVPRSGKVVQGDKKCQWVWFTVCVTERCVASTHARVQHGLSPVCNLIDLHKICKIASV